MVGGGGGGGGGGENGCTAGLRFVSQMTSLNHRRKIRTLLSKFKLKRTYQLLQLTLFITYKYLHVLHNNFIVVGLYKS